MNNARKHVAAAFATVALVTAVAPATASADPGLDCIKKSVAAHVDRIINGGPYPLPCG